MKTEEENEEQQERKKMKCWIGSKAHNVIYNPAKFQNEKHNIFGDNDSFVPTKGTGIGTVC